jgi:hypothetical protein
MRYVHERDPRFAALPTFAVIAAFAATRSLQYLGHYLPNYQQVGGPPRERREGG